MSNGYPENARVFVIDEDRKVRSTLTRVFESAHLPVETFGAAKEFLERSVHDGPSCLVLHLQLPELRGLAAPGWRAGAGVSIPVVYLTSQADVPSSARAMREGAVDVLVKPVDGSELLDAAARALTQAASARQQRQEQSEAAARIARLTARERQVVELVGHGLLNKQIALELGISEMTVKVHRGHAMRKLEIDSVPSLVRLLDRAIA
jgi:FixJ family two-component response regulator